MSKILIVDDEVQIRTLLARMMELEGYEVCQAGDCRAALKQLELQSPDVALCDVFLPDGNGVDLVLAIKKATPNVEVILLTAHGNIPDGVQAIKNGAFDYITKGDDNNKIIPLISRAVEKAAMNARLEKLEKKVGQAYSFDSILGESKSLKDAVLLAQKVSVTDVPVLLTGETGTGKEVFAQSIHYSSKRARQNFVAVNCSSFSKELLESEMFGHKAGSFTGALKDKKGLFEEANNGTIFLDEIGELPLPMQAKLLRVLETGEIQKIAHKGQLHSDFRLIGATNRNLAEMVRQGQFREDLYHRLSVFELDIPPLRDRVSDIPLLVRHFVTQSVGDNRQKDIRIDDALYDAFAQYPWRGNVRELKNVLVYALYSLGDDQSVLTVQHLPPRFMRELEAAAVAGTIPDAEDSRQDSQNFSEASARAERKVLWDALVNSRYNKVLAARTLGISRSKLYRKLREHGLLAKFEAQ